MRIEELAKRATACKGWWWMPGMRWEHDVYAGGGDGLPRFGRVIGASDCFYGVQGARVGAFPDLTDAATLGCLLHLVRKAYQRSGAHAARPMGGPWILCDILGLPLHAGAVDTGEVISGETEIEALVAALEAAP